MLDRERYSFGDVLEAAYDAAMNDWHRSYASSLAADELFAGPVRGVTETAQIHPGGYATVTVTVNARRAYQTQVYFFLLQRTNGLWIVRADGLENPEP